MKLLLHTCCGPCFLGVWKDLEGRNLEVTNYFYNPNIYPEEEYIKRLDNLKVVTKDRTNEVIEAKYESEKYNTIVDDEERCLNCYRLRLENTAKYAKEYGFDAFSTTLFVSPYQKHEDLKKICEDISNTVGINFYYKDWRPYFRSGQDEAKVIPIYRQKYCGCKFSKN